MPRKQQKKTPPPKAANDKAPRDRIIEAALHLAAVQGWDHCTVRDIAAEAGVDLPEFYDHFEERSDILVAYARRLDRQVLSAFAEPDYETGPRDRLFDIIMERFDLANQDREALVSIIKSHRADPKQVIVALSHLGGSMAKMLDAAGLETTGLRGALRVAGLSAAYIWVLRSWLEDESEDLSKTMASLDKCLGNLETAANTFGL